MLPATLLTASRQHRHQTDSRSEAAYRILKEKIVTLDFPPAAVLNEAQLMAELNLGRTPIREALQRLAFDNLVIILPRRGTIVADLNMSDIQKICFDKCLNVTIKGLGLTQLSSRQAPVFP